ncbi:MAG: hypothetical protein WBF89_03870 [Steroidobacteraceae bacterium]
MDTEPRRRQVREYLWFALFLLAVLMVSIIQKNGNTVMRGDPAAAKIANGAPE